MIKKLLIALSLLPLFAHAQIPAANDTTLITGSTSFTPQNRFTNVTLSGVNYRIPQVYNPIAGKYDTYVTTKYLRAFYAPLVGGGYVSLSRYLNTNDNLHKKTFDTIKVHDGFGDSLTIKPTTNIGEFAIYNNENQVFTSGAGVTRLNSPGSTITLGLASNSSAITINSGIGLVNSLPTRLTNVGTGSITDRIAMLDPSTGLVKYLPGNTYGNGTVTNVSSANTDISVATGSSTPVLTLNSGTGANQIAKRDASGNFNATTVTTNANLTGPVTSVGNATSISKNIALNGATPPAWSSVINSIDLQPGQSIGASSNTLTIYRNSYFGAANTAAYNGNAGRLNLTSTGLLSYTFGAYRAAGATQSFVTPFQVDSTGRGTFSGNINFATGSDASGDMYYRTATPTNGLGRIGIGANGTVLSSDGTAIPKYQSLSTILGYTPANGANYLALSGGTRTLSDNLYIGSANTHYGAFSLTEALSGFQSSNRRGIENISTVDFTTSGNPAYAAIAAEAQLIGGGTYDHFVGMQSEPFIKSTSSANIGRVDAFVTGTNHQGSGTITDNTGFRVYETTGSGAITNNYGLYIPTLTRGTNNYSIVTGSAPTILGGNVSVVGTLGASLPAYTSGSGILSLYNTTNNRFEAFSAAQTQSFLGLGSNAYTSTAYVAKAGDTMTGALTVNNKITVGDGVFSTNTTSLYHDATVGSVLTLKSGTSKDFLMGSPSGATIFSVPTGTVNVDFGGTISATGGLANGTTATTGTPGAGGTNVSTQAYADAAVANNGRTVVSTSATSITIPTLAYAGSEYNLILTGSSLQTVTLPLTISQGVRISITGAGTGGWKLAQTLDVVKTTGASTTAGASGFVASTAQGNSITIECTQATLGAGAATYFVQSVVGSPTYN